MDAVLQQFLALGPTGAIVVCFLIGAIAPKWVIDEYRKREVAKDAIIAQLTATLTKVVEQADR